jgi:ribosome maturation factor RimP
MADIAALARLIEPEAKAEGFDLVRVRILGGASDPTLQVMAERPDTRQLSLDDCTRLSRRLSDLLDREDPIEGSYRLEVSSPGIDRPLTRRKDFEDWKGHQARISLSEPRDGRKQFTGELKGNEGADILLDVPATGTVRIPFEAVHNAKLLMTDKLIRATAPLSTAGADKISVEG